MGFKPIELMFIAIYISPFLQVVIRESRAAAVKLTLCSMKQFPLLKFRIFSLLKTISAETPKN
jgi:hypothetical protein